MKTPVRASRLVVVPVLLVVGALSIGCPALESGQLNGGDCGGALYVAQGGDSVTSSHLWRMELADDGRSISRVVDLGDIGVALTGLAQHPVTHEVFGVTTNYSNNRRSLVRVDLSGRRDAEVIGPLYRPGNVVTTIAELEFDPSGALHGWSEDGDRPVLIDTATGAVNEAFPDPGLSTFGDADGLYFNAFFISYLRGDDDLYIVDYNTGSANLVLNDVAYPPTSCGVGDAPMSGGTVVQRNGLNMFYTTRIDICAGTPYPSDLTFFDINLFETGIVTQLPPQSDALVFACDPALRECNCT